jgi:hypothetical protein
VRRFLSAFFVLSFFSSSYSIEEDNLSIRTSLGFAQSSFSETIRYSNSTRLIYTSSANTKFVFNSSTNIGSENVDASYLIGVDHKIDETSEGFIFNRVLLNRISSSPERHDAGIGYKETYFKNNYFDLSLSFAPVLTHQRNQNSFAYSLRSKNVWDNKTIRVEFFYWNIFKNTNEIMHEADFIFKYHLKRGSLFSSLNIYYTNFFEYNNSFGYEITLQ